MGKPDHDAAIQSECGSVSQMIVDRDATRPSLPLYLTDAGRACAEFTVLTAMRPFRPALPRGDGHPVLVLPGLLGDDRSTRKLRQILRGLGYRAHGWRLGRNLGPTEVALRGMRLRLDSLHDRYEAPVSVVGWSLGGVFARDLARCSPISIRQVITLGSPFRLANRNQSRAHGIYDHLSALHAEVRQLPWESDEAPLPVPTSSIYSRLDGIVAWQACLNLPSPRSENIRIVGSHLGLGFNPAAIWATADRLSQPVTHWVPFRAPLALRPLFPKPDTPA